MPKITKRFIDSLKPPERGECFHWDADLRGFGVRILASGSARFFVQYRTPHGQTRRMTLAAVGEKTPEEARSLARKALGAVREGRDPSAERKAARKARTFAELVEAYQSSPAWERKSAGSRAIDSGRIERHLLPLVGKKIVETLRRSDMERVFRDIRDGKTAMDAPSGKARGRVRVTGGEGTARRTLALAAAILSYGVREGVIGVNPCAGVDTGRDGSREAIIDDADAYGRLFRALSELEDRQEAPAAAVNAIRLIALLGVRRGEITGLRWRSVDFENSRLVLQPGEHKTGHQTGKHKTIALPAAAAA
uniref:tyrosine-type recombinase/integrase n=1 Tax=Rhodoblastus sp. TaxID=1962975 RepID=UPI00261A6474